MLQFELIGDMGLAGGVVALVFLSAAAVVVSSLVVLALVRVVHWE